MTQPPGENPFEGTPFEQIFSNLGSGQMPDLGALLGQMQSLLQPYDGPVNWDVVVDQARKQIASKPDPSVTGKDSAAVADALQLADHWLDGATSFPSGVTTPAAWSRAEWLVNTIEVWKRLVEPVAGSAVTSLASALPEELRAQAGPLIGFLGKAMGALVATQVASGLGALADDVLTASDIGLPLAKPGTAALLPANLAEFAEGLDVPREDALLYFALREAAHQRLFSHTDWLREHLLDAVTAYAEGVEVDTTSIENRLQSIDPTNPESFQEALNEGLFEVPRSPQQLAALSRLEVTLALVEGWVDEVVGQATAERMPSAARLQEAVRRRRAAGGPAEATFSSLVGLELRPRRLRDASTLWGSLRTRFGIEARDAVWLHPGLLPTDHDLDDPLGFREDSVTPDEISDEAFEAGLRDLLDGDEGSSE